MRDYQQLLSQLLTNGEPVMDRTGTGTRSLKMEHLTVGLQDGFPLLTTKRVFWKGVVAELLWFLSGSTNNNDLTQQGVTIWNEWADENGELGPVYGAQWRKWSYFDGRLGWTAVDQISLLVGRLLNQPNSRRNIVTAWNPGELSEMALPPCHFAFQFMLEHGRLCCQVHMRSCDAFLGLPFNIASYSLLTHMIAQVTGLKVGRLNITFGDLHLYDNHIEQAREQIRREPRTLPTLWLNDKITDIDAFGPKDIGVLGYDPHPAIKAEVAA